MTPLVLRSAVARRLLRLLATTTCLAILLPCMAWAEPTDAPNNKMRTEPPAASEGLSDESHASNATNPSSSAATAPQTASQSMSGENVWLMMSAALVMFMTTPGLALFYSGLVRKKNVLSVFMQCIFLVSIMSVIWCLYGYSLAFGDGKSLNWFIGGTDHIFLQGVAREWNDATQSPVTPMWRADGVETHVTMYAHMIYQCMFFVIAPAIMCGAFAERMKFHGMVAFSALWGTFVYCPIAHWIWGGGFLSYPNGLGGGALDFAGGTVVHVCSGVSAFIAAAVIGPRLGFGKDPMPPHNLTYTAIGASMLWFGWFGFNAGSGIGNSDIATSSFAVTHFAAASGAIGWWLIEWRMRGKPTVLGVSTGLVAGLVCITPAAGFVHPISALIMGFAAGIACYFACGFAKRLAGHDDALDAFWIHGVGGILGSILTAVFATRACYNIGDGNKLGLLEGGWIVPGQLIAIAITIAYSATVSLILLKIVDWTIGLRVTASDERQGLDVQQHGEEGYIFL